MTPVPVLFGIGNRVASGVWHNDKVVSDVGVLKDAPPRECTLQGAL